MAKAKIARLTLIGLLVAIALVSFFVVAAPVLSMGQNDRHSILAHFINGHANIVDFDLGIALTNTLITIFPVAFFFLMFDLYGLRKTPVKHLGVFAFCLIAVALNVIVSIAIWLIYGGWGPPAVGPIMAVIMLGTFIPAMVSEWRIFNATEENKDNAV